MMSASKVGSREDVTPDDLRAGFSEPHAAYSPAPMWWWSGERVELDRLRWQLDRLVEQGVYNAVVINLAPTGPMYGERTDDPPVFSEDWWALWRGICEHARGRGARLWFYDQLGFSGTNLQGELVQSYPRFAGALVERVVREIDPDERGPVELACPEAGLPIGASALRLDASGNVVGAPEPLEIADDRVRWEGAGGSGRRRLMLAYALRRGFDYTSREACLRLLDRMHGEFDRRLGGFLGDVIAGTYQGELPSLPTWSPTFAEEFAQRCGYRIEPVIAGLWEDGGSAMARVRRDYHKVRAELCEEALFRPLLDWHERRGMIAGADQLTRHAEPLLSTHHYADYARTQRWFNAPGNDHQGDSRFHASLAKHYGRPRVWLEGFHTSGWGATLEEFFDWLVPRLLAGANLFDPHAVYYSTRGGWWEWAPPSTCWRQPYWRHYRLFADTVSRLCWLVAQGEHVCDIGVLYPTATVQAGTLLEAALPAAERAHEVYLDIVGRMRWFDTAPGVLERDGRDFAVLDDDTVRDARVADGVLSVTGGTYRVVIVPACTMLEGPVAAALAGFADRGGVVVFVDRLPEQATDADGEAQVRRLRELVDTGVAHLAEDPGDLPALLWGVERTVTTDGPARHQRVGDRHVLLVPAAPQGSATSQPLLPSRRWWKLPEQGYDFDPRRFRRDTVVRIAGAIQDVETWDPTTGATRPAEVVAVDDDGTAVRVRFDQAPLAVLVWRDGDPRQAEERTETAPADPEVHWHDLPLDGAWTASVVPTIDNRFGDLALPASTATFPVQQWRLRRRVQTAQDQPRDETSWADPDLDDGGWGEVLVGNGTFAWLAGPAPAPELEEPDVWEPVRYSLSRGIERDPVHVWTRGTSGRVPDEFWRVESVAVGDTVVLRTSLPSDTEQQLTLAVAANGDKQVRWNGEFLGNDPGGFLRLDPVVVQAGHNLLEVRVTAEAPETPLPPMYQVPPLRGYWALVTDAEAFRRPAWIRPADEGRRGSELVATKVVTLPGTPHEGRIQLGTEGPARLVVNGEEVAIQGAFDPYGRFRVLPHDLAEHLHEGDNRLEVVLTDLGNPQAAFADARIQTSDDHTTPVLSDTSWTFTRDGSPVATALRRDHPFDAQWAALTPRPHPLPQARWLHPDHLATDHDGVVVDVVPDADPESARPVEWFRTLVPPGATSATLPVPVGRMRVWLDGVELAPADGEVELHDRDRERRVLTVAIRPEDGRTEGALWDGPIEFRCEPGRLSPGAWAEAGLGSYSGAVSYRRRIELDPASRRVELDLGIVRGTAEVHLNGEHAGTRIWSPYRFDVTDLARPGTNDLEVTVCNTLAPYLGDASPTPHVYPGHRPSGPLGSIRLLTADADVTGARRRHA